MTGMVGVAGKEKDENESSTFFHLGLLTLQVVLTWVQGRPDEGRVALEDVFPPWSIQQIREVDGLAFFMRVQKSRFRQFARCNLF